MTDTTRNLDPRDGILKVDRLGRVQTPPERREALLDEFERSGMSAKAFAGHYGIKYQTFCGWRHQRRKHAGSAAKRPRRNRTLPMRAKPSFTLALAEVAGPSQPESRPAAAALHVELAGGHRLLVNNRQGASLAAELIRALGNSPASPC